MTMYNPPRFRSENMDEVFEMMDTHPFATVISVTGGEPFVSHLPLTPKRSGNKIELLGHLAKANSHWKSLSSATVTILFHGPHTYITPEWYAEKNVPTWNYTALHVRGRVELIEDHDGIVRCLSELTNHVERLWPSGWEFFIPEDLAGSGQLSKNIVGFKVDVDEFNFKKKLGQGGTTANRAGVLRGLETRSDDNSRAVLAEMRKLISLSVQAKR